MSKRDQGASLTSYLDEGYAPEAVVNYLCLLGWSPKGNREKIPLDEVVALFDLPQVLRHNARFDLVKLQWLNYEYLREMRDERFYELCVHALARAGLNPDAYPLDYVKRALDTCKGKLKLFADLPAYAGFYFQREVIPGPDAATKDFVPENRPRVRKLRDAFARVATWEAPALELALKATATECGVKAGVLVHPTRLATTGQPTGPSLYHLLEVLGRDCVLGRLDQALARPEFGG